jgi:hypothetical protein
MGLLTVDEILDVGRYGCSDGSRVFRSWVSRH